MATLIEMVHDENLVLAVWPGEAIKAIKTTTFIGTCAVHYYRSCA